MGAEAPNEGASLFQFHKGTIKPGKHYDDQTLAHLFQFHKGTIKPTKICHYRLVFLLVSIP